MAKRLRSIRITIFFLGLILIPTCSRAADFELFWDANCDADTSLQGYNIYYNENASVVDNPSGADTIYVSVSDNGFQRTQPSYQISDLLDDVRYCFAVTALYNGNEESDLSNEICGINGTYAPEPEPEPDPNPEPDPDDEQHLVIIDDSDAGSFSSGAWIVSSGTEPYGTRSLYSEDVGATYGYETSVTGRYEAAIWWTYYTTRCSEVPIEIYDGEVLLDTVLVDQTQNSGQWNILGTYEFSNSARVVVISNADNCSTCADAASFSSILSDQETEPDQQPSPGIDPNPGTGINPSVNKVINDGSMSGCFITQLK